MKYERILPLLVFIFLVGILVLIQSPAIKNREAASRENVGVLRVMDGDTIKVLINNKEDAVRLIGIDSPEVLDERKPV